MILGYMLIDSGGTLILSEEIVKLTTEERKALFASAISAVTNLFNEIFKSKVKHVELENLHFYFGFSKNYVLVLVSDVEDDMLQTLVDEILRNIELQNIDLDEVSIKPELRQKIGMIIKETIFTSTFSIQTIQKLAKMVIASVDLTKGEKLGFKYIPPRKYKPGLLARIAKRFGKPTLEGVLKKFYEGKLEDVIKDAPDLFEKDKDLALALYAKAGLTLNSYDPRVPAPSLDEVHTAINKIEDEALKKLLLAELEAFYELGGSGKIHDVFMKYQFSFYDKLNDPGIKGDIYSLVLSSVNLIPLLEYLEHRFRSKSDFVTAQVLETKYFMLLSTRPPMEVSEWLSLLGELKVKFNEAYQRRSPSAPYYFNILFFTFIWGITNKGLSEDDAIKLIKEYEEKFEAYREEIIDKSIRVTNRHRMHILYLEYLIKLLMFEIEGVNSDILRKHLEYLKGKLEYLIGLGQTNRVMQDTYYASIAGLISILSRLAYETGTFIADIPEIITNLADPKIVALKEYNEYQYARYLADLLIALGNTALFIPLEVLRGNILLQIAHGIELVARTFHSKPLIYYHELVQALRFYLLSKTPAGKEKAKELFDELKEGPPIIRKLAEIVHKKHGGE